MKNFNVGIIGATGMVGQRFLLLLEKNPWFSVKVLAASNKNKGKTYEEAIKGRWKFNCPIPQIYKDIVLYDAVEDIEAITNQVDFVFCALNMKKDDIKNLEEAYAKLECPVISNNSANRDKEDVPMVIPEINSSHIKIIDCQKKRLKTKKGFIAVKSNCSIQSYVPAISPLLEFCPTHILACTYQAISGAGKTFTDWKHMEDNLIPYIKGEEQKSETEPLKIWGKIENNKIINNNSISITTQCIRVPITDGHMACVFVKFKQKPSIEQIKKKWQTFEPEIQKLNLPSSPKKFLTYFEQDDRPQTKVDRNIENGMGISIGRLRADTQYDYKFVSLSHNTIRGAAGGAILLAELLVAKKYIY